MNTKQLQTTQIPKIPKSTLGIILLALLIILAGTSCSSVCNRKKSITNVLNQQNALIESLNAYRAEESLKQKILADPALKHAELKLQDTLKAISESNKRIQEAMKSENKEEQGE